MICVIVWKNTIKLKDPNSRISRHFSVDIFMLQITSFISNKRSVLDSMDSICASPPTHTQSDRSIHTHRHAHSHRHRRSHGLIFRSVHFKAIRWYSGNTKNVHEYQETHTHTYTRRDKRSDNGPNK